MISFFLSFFFFLPVTEALVLIQDGVNQELGQLNLNLNYWKIVAQFKIQEVGNRNREEKKISVGPLGSREWKAWALRNQSLEWSGVS